MRAHTAVCVRRVVAPRVCGIRCPLYGALAWSPCRANSLCKCGHTRCQVARFCANGAYFCSKNCGSMGLFSKLLQQNTVCTCKHRDIDMPRKNEGRKVTRKQHVDGSPGSTALVAVGGGHSEVSSPCAAGASSSFISPSQDSAGSPSPEKGVRQQATRRGLQACLEGSWQGQSPAHALTFAHVSSGRAAPRKIPLVEEGQESVGGKRAPPAPPKVPSAAARNAVSAGSLRAKTVAVPTTAENMPGDDQQTQDAAGQAAAPHMRFQVRTGTVILMQWLSVRCMQPFVVCIRIVCENN